MLYSGPVARKPNELPGGARTASRRPERSLLPPIPLSAQVCEFLPRSPWAQSLPGRRRALLYAHWRCRRPPPSGPRGLAASAGEDPRATAYTGSAERPVVRADRRSGARVARDGGGLSYMLGGRVEREGASAGAS